MLELKKNILLILFAKETKGKASRPGSCLFPSAAPGAWEAQTGMTEAAPARFKEPHPQSAGYFHGQQ